MMKSRRGDIGGVFQSGKSAVMIREPAVKPKKSTANKIRRAVESLSPKAAAVITIRDADKMTPAGRKAIADWLRNHAKWLLKHGDQYAPSFRGRYCY